LANPASHGSDHDANHTHDTSHGHGAEAVDDDRRNFIHIATGAVAFGGLGMFAWAAVDQWNPAADTKAASSLDVDISKLPVGSEVRVLIGGKPFFIRHRNEAEIKAAASVNLAALRDPQTDEERLVAGPDGKFNKAILVTSGSCTHLGCVPVGPSQGNTGDFGGWYCPCHGSHYDTSGRIRKGPAPANLPVPTYKYVSASVINISL
jgi:ubiquinol-cytochrome c reductase iron-sulfur subunit